jgi:NAD(P)-dependent dehydrogenase (short-subunit alcohol dehydrogenase family)
MKQRSINPVLAGLVAVLDHYRERSTLRPIAETDRLDGKTCLLTGPSSGLGRVLATELARRGATLILAARAGHAQLAEEVRKESGNPNVSQRLLDLADLQTVTGLADTLKAEGVKLDLLISNAAVASLENRKTKDGFAELFQVNFLGSFVLIHRLLSDGTLKPGARLLLTSSEGHRSAPPIDFEKLGEFPDFNMLTGTTWYGHSKLYVQTFATELGRRLAGRSTVLSYCPGAFRSKIGREAGLAGKLMTSFFIDPKTAMWPALYCATTPSIESQRYFYLRHEAQPDPLATDPANGDALFEKTYALLAKAGLPLQEVKD